MAHYAFLDENNIVTEVITGRDEGEMGIDWELHYAEFRPGKTCKRTSYNSTIRKHYAGIGYIYDELLDAFLMPKCHDEATLNLDSYLWECENNDHQVPII